VIKIGETLAVAAKGKGRSIVLADLFFQGRAPRGSTTRTRNATAEAGAAEQKIAAIVIVLAPIVEAGNGDMTTTSAIFIDSFAISHQRHYASDGTRLGGIHQEMAHEAA